MSTSPTIPQRPTTRALVGTMALVLFIFAYAMAAMVLAVTMLPNAGGLIEFVYYAIAGLAWVPVAGLIIRWMYLPPRSGRARP